MRRSILFLVILFITLVAPLNVRAQGASAVQELRGSLATGQVDVFRLAGMKQGQSVSAFMENTSGNLDPLLLFLSADQDLSATLASYSKAVADLVASSPTPLLDLPAIRDKYTLAWDDDSGPGYSAALNFTIPADGDYFLIAGSSLSAAGRQTSGS